MDSLKDQFSLQIYILDFNDKSLRTTLGVHYWWQNIHVWLNYPFNMFSVIVLSCIGHHVISYVTWLTCSLIIWGQLDWGQFSLLAFPLWKHVSRLCKRLSKWLLKQSYMRVTPPQSLSLLHCSLLHSFKEYYNFLWILFKSQWHSWNHILTQVLCDFLFSLFLFSLGGDQGVLNSYFSDWATADISKHLPFIYNLSSIAIYTYLPAFKQWVRFHNNFISEVGVRGLWFLIWIDISICLSFCMNVRFSCRCYVFVVCVSVAKVKWKPSHIATS